MPICQFPSSHAFKFIEGYKIKSEKNKQNFKPIIKSAYELLREA